MPIELDTAPAGSVSHCATLAATALAMRKEYEDQIEKVDVGETDDERGAILHPLWAIEDAAILCPARDFADVVAKARVAVLAVTDDHELPTTTEAAYMQAAAEGAKTPLGALLALWADLERLATKKGGAA